MKRKLTFLISAICCILLLSTLSIYFFLNCRQNAMGQTSDGVFSFERSDNPFYADYELAGEWEFYPDKLIFSANSDGNVPGNIESANPLTIFTDWYHNRLSVAPSEEYAKTLTSTLPNSDADKIFIPSSYAQPWKRQRMIGTCASYRTIIQVDRYINIDEDKMAISLPGLPSGNYRVYINGKPGKAFMVSPWSYPLYRIDNSSVIEVVIEVSNTSEILNICPRLTSLGLTMTYFDTYKNSFIILSSILFATFAILLFSIFSIDPRRFRGYFLTSLLFTAYFFINNCWIIGYMERITNVIPMFLLTYISRLLVLACWGLAILISHHTGPQRFSRKIYRMFTGLLLGAALCFTLALFLPVSGVFVVTGQILLRFLGISWLIKTWQGLDALSIDGFLFHLGYLYLLTGMFANYIYNSFGLPGKTLFLLPVCIITFGFLIFTASKLYQKQLLTHTQNLLTLEKEASRIQTAMLSSQIQPHFLYNTLTTIQEMCYTDPEQAADLIVHFSRYLRTNIDFMDYTDLIPFEKELEHIENYLYIQNTRFGNALVFEKDITVTEFQIPPLSVQPLIENAIKYGIRKNGNHGTIRLETKQTAKGICILVKNSGPGFDEQKINLHHSIQNIRSRMDYLLHGTLIIHSQEGAEGTVMELLLPYQNQT